MEKDRYRGERWIHLSMDRHGPCEFANAHLMPLFFCGGGGEVAWRGKVLGSLNKAFWASHPGYSCILGTPEFKVFLFMPGVFGAFPIRLVG